MTAKELLLHQTKNSHYWITKLSDDLPPEKWDIISEEVNSSFKWQIGHVIVSQYYHAILVINGPDQSIIDSVDTQKYYKYFTFGNFMNEINENFSVDELKKTLKIIQSRVINIIDNFGEDAYNHELFNPGFTHPIAKNKLEALSWNVQHNMWHCGQMATLSRLHGSPILSFAKMKETFPFS